MAARPLQIPSDNDDGRRGDLSERICSNHAICDGLRVPVAGGGAVKEGATKLSDRRWAESENDTMGRQSHKAIGRILKIGSMTEPEAKAFLRSEKRGEPEKL